MARRRSGDRRRTPLHAQAYTPAYIAGTYCRINPFPRALARATANEATAYSQRTSAVPSCASASLDERAPATIRGRIQSTNAAVPSCASASLDERAPATIRGRMHAAQHARTRAAIVFTGTNEAPAANDSDRPEALSLPGRDMRRRSPSYPFRSLR